jgi:hypothetical protein
VASYDFFRLVPAGDDNLQVVVSRRRPICSSIACSRPLVPSGNVPVYSAVDYVAKHHRGVEGAGPDCVFKFPLQDLAIIFHFLLVPVVNWYSTDKNGWILLGPSGPSLLKRRCRSNAKEVWATQIAELRTYSCACPYYCGVFGSSAKPTWKLTSPKQFGVFKIQDRSERRIFGLQFI